MGSFDPTLHGFAPLRYIGSNFSQGSLADSEPCVRGMDNAGYIMGTSSTLFNQFLLNIGGTSVPTIIKNALTKVLERVGKNQEDIADWSPNPFFGWNKQANPNANTKSLTLVDGGEDLQNIPLQPLIQPVRHVDVIFAVDSSADTLGIGPNWPNGTAIVATYQRSLDKKMTNGTAFPSIPDQNTIVNLGLNTHPTFFGCNSSNMTGPSPIVVYLPNAPYVFFSNISTFTAAYNDSDRDGMIHNGYISTTMGNGTVDPLWPTCVGCAILSRSLERTKTKVPDVCTACFNTYCWNGTVNSTTPLPYNPPLGMPNFRVVTGKKKNAAGTLVPTSSFIALLISWGIASLVAL
jgi:lysophospholipase